MRPCPILALSLLLCTGALPACDGDGGGAPPADVVGDTAEAPGDAGGEVAAPDAGGDAAPDDAQEADVVWPPEPPGPCTLEHRDRDGELVAVLTYTWEAYALGQRIEHIDFDEGGDGTVDDVWEYRYDEQDHRTHMEGVGYPNTTYTYDFREVDDHTCETDVDMDGDGEVDDTQRAEYDDQGRLVRLEIWGRILAYSDFDEWGNGRRRESDAGGDGTVEEICTASYRGLHELVRQECFRQPEESLISRVTIAWEDGREVLQVVETVYPSPDGTLSEQSRDVLDYDARGWLARETHYETVGGESRPKYELRHAYGCWE